MTFDGNMNTGLTLRTLRMQDGVAEIRAGATLLYDSDPEAEEAECRLKAAALLSAIRGDAIRPQGGAARVPATARRRQVLLIDHEDSFVHTLAGYVRTTGAECVTLRHDFARARLREGLRPDLVLLSPGPGRPDDFAMRETLDLLLRRNIPIFGVCLGLQGIVEYFGGIARSARGADARQAVAGAPPAEPAAAGSAGALHGRPLSFAPCRARPAAAGAGDRGRDRGGRRHHGRRTSQPADRGGAVPSPNRS